ncbi:MAG TPA: hypothetical protein VNJ01_07150 [Bacteriovoracaceae bacterium]|nr:hypothetical protein [Bacteriovoracaceae bacterium]
MKLLTLSVLTLSLNLSTAIADCRVRVMYQLENYSESTIESLASAVDKSEDRLSKKLPGLKLGLNGFFRSSKNVVGTLNFSEQSYSFKNGLYEVTVESSFDAYEDTSRAIVDDNQARLDEVTAENLRIYTSNKSREAALEKALENSIKLQKLEHRIPKSSCL